MLRGSRFVVARRPLLLLTFAALVAPLHAFATDYVFTGAGETTNPRSWTNPANWSPNGVPGASDTASINFTSAAISGLSGTVVGLTLSDGYLSGGSLTVANSGSSTGTFTWTGGTLAATVNVAAGASWVVSGTASKLLTGGTVNNAGNAVWTGGWIAGSNGAAIHNSGIFDARLDGTFAFDRIGTTASATFVNSGTFSKSGGNSALYFQDCWTLANTGVIDVSSGVIALTGTASGAHVLRDGSQIQNGPLWIGYAPSSTVSAPLTLSGTVSFASNGWLQLSDGAKVGGNATLTGPGAVVWSGGEIDGNFGTDALTFDRGLPVSITGSSTKRLLGGAILNNAGAITWDGSGVLVVDQSTINNSGSFAIASDAILSDSTPGAFHNSGTFSKGGTSGATTIRTVFTNSGTVELTSGTLVFDRAQHQGFLQTAGMLRLNGGTLTAIESSLGGALQDVNVSGGQVVGVGTIHANLVNGGGEVLPNGRGAIGVLHVDGDFTQSGQGKLTVDLHGTDSSQYDQLTVAGVAHLGGALAVELTTAFVPAQGQSFDVVTFSSSSGAFNALSLPPTAPEMNADVTVSTVTLTVPKHGGCSVSLGCLDAAAVLSILAAFRSHRSRRARRPVTRG